MTDAIKIKAIIKYCKFEGTNVVYFKSGSRFFKMTSNKSIRLTSYVCVGQMVKQWNAKSIIDVVHTDEQVLLKGEPIFLSHTLMSAPASSHRKLRITQ